MDRRVLIADAAIEVLAREGPRGLTHRAIDQLLELPTGSTSYYFRTRAALLAAAADRLVTLDREDIAAIRVRDAADYATMVERWLRPKNRARLIARYELFLGAPRSADSGPLASARARFAEGMERGLAGLGAGNPRVAALALNATIDGLLLEGMMGTRLTAAERRAIIEAAVQFGLDT